MFHLWEEHSIPEHVKLFRDNWPNKRNSEAREKSSCMEAPGLMCGLKRLRMLICSLGRDLTGNICFNLLQHQHDQCGRKPVVTVWAPFLQPELGLRSGLFGQAGQYGPICQNMDITGSIIWEYPGATSLFRRNYFPSKPGSLFISLYLFSFMFSLSWHISILDFNCEWSFINLNAATTSTPMSENGFLWRMILPEGIKIPGKQVCKDADSHPLTLTKP